LHHGLKQPQPRVNENKKRRKRHQREKGTLILMIVTYVILETSLISKAIHDASTTKFSFI
jgi:hypothetical protein